MANYDRTEKIKRDLECAYGLLEVCIDPYFCVKNSDAIPWLRENLPGFFGEYTIAREKALTSGIDVSDYPEDIFSHTKKRVSEYSKNSSIDEKLSKIYFEIDGFISAIESQRDINPSNDTFQSNLTSRLTDRRNYRN